MPNSAKPVPTNVKLIEHRHQEYQMATTSPTLQALFDVVERPAGALYSGRNDTTAIYRHAFSQNECFTSIFDPQGHTR